MAEKQEWVQLRCPECDHVIVSAPKDALPSGELLCPGCGAKSHAPSRLERWVAEARDKTKAIVRDLKSEK
jgi:hypothetical protein